MQYLGGKSRIAKQIANVILASTSSRFVYVEPFVGGGSVAAELAPRFGQAYLSDASPDLIALWQALQDGWTPPETVSETEYQAQRQAPASALRGFVGYGCSFGGKWFGGYARRKDNSLNYAATSARSAVKIASVLSCAEFRCVDYANISIPRGAVVYCDPPYANTTSYAGLDRFCAETFWQRAKEWSAYADVYVSEFLAPPGWRAVWEASPYKSLRSSVGRTRVERLWVYGGADASG